MSRFAGRSVIVTGGAKGIGAAICTAFAEEGARVMCADVDVAAGETLAAEAPAAGEIRFQRADMSQREDCGALIAATMDAFGAVDVLCNNVGIQPTDSYQPIHEMSDENWERIIGVNLKSVFLMSRGCLRHMLDAGRGVIINTASVQGLQSAKGVPAYAASKGAILSLTRQMALEYAEQGIRVLAVNPGTIDTPLVDDALEVAGG
ncbi:MAG: SDR family oxidoreductase, partial [Gemmatimonadetes bacterium]|nr:SDR family oxidoreductase [Gemmatimonadota bacterium]